MYTARCGKRRGLFMVVMKMSLLVLAASLALFVGGARATCTEEFEDTVNEIANTGVDGAFVAVAADFDNDDVNDVLVAARGADKFVMFGGTGAGSFASGVDIITSYSDMRAVCAADFDGDGDVDFFSAEFSGVAAWFENTGSLAFTEHALTVGSSLRGAYCADIDGDGAVDVAGARQSANTVSWFENTNGDASSWSMQYVGTHTGARSVFVADLDGDTDMDMVTAGDGGGGLVYTWESDGASSPTFTGVTVLTSSGLFSVHGMDIESDGDTDFAVAGYGSEFYLFTNDGTGRFTSSQISTTNALHLQACNVFGGTEGQFFLADNSGGRVVMIETDGTETELYSGVDGVYHVFCADMNGDGSLDVLSATSDGNSVEWVANAIESSCLPSDAPSLAPTGLASYSPTAEPTKVPTALPTALPSRFPTAHPSTAPSTMPTPRPTLIPTTSPSAAPSTSPTPVPSVLPTVSPTSQPSTSPTVTPSASPTAAPTPLPSSIPTGAPSTSPSASPTPQPSVVPSTLPTAMPSTLPTRNPSAVPSMQPTALPSTVPSSHPSAAPSKLPTALPSAVPTPHPSAAPSTLPTAHPSAFPTVAPSMSPTPLGTTVAGNLSASYREATARLQTIANKQSTTNGNDGAWGYVHYRNADGDTVAGTCGDWRDFTLTSLATDVDDVRYTNARVIQWRLADGGDDGGDISGTGSSTVETRAATCSNATRVDRLANALVSARNATEECDDHLVWRVAACSASAEVSSFCINCSNPCACSSVDEQADNVWLPLASCGGDGAETGCETEIVHLAVWSYNPEYVVPPIDNVSVEKTTSESIRLRVNLTAPAYVTCVALDANETFTGIEMMQTHATATEVYQASPLDAAAAVPLTGLQPLTEYSVHCGVRDRKGRWATDGDVASLRQPVATTCCHHIQVDAIRSGVARAALTVNDTSGEVFLSVSHAPIEVNVTAFFVSGSGSTCVSQWSTNLVGQAGGATLFPLSVDGAPIAFDAVASEVSFVARASAPGCLYLGLEPAGPHAADFDVLFVDADGVAVNVTSTDTLAIRVKESDAEPAAPLLSSAQFANTGASVSLDFDSDTDRGSRVGLTSPFPCKQLLSTVSDGSMCSWKSNARVVMTLPAGSTLAVSDTLSVRADVLKARCTRQDGNCTDWAFATASSATVQAPAEPVEPSLTLRGGGTVTACEPVSIGVSEVVGSGGRDWSTANWDVVVDDDGGHAGTDPSRLAAFLNANGSIEALFSVPAHLFDTGVSYILTLSLTNFLGGEASDSMSVEQVEDESLPQVAIDGAASVTLKVADSGHFVARGWQTTCDGAAAETGTMTFSWAVLSSTSGLDIGVVSASNDSRVLSFAPGTLAVGLYTARAIVYSASGGTASATVQIVVDSGSVQASIAGQQLSTVHAASNFSLNASSSFDEDVPGSTGASAGLTFHWSCQELSPQFGRACGYDTSGDTGEVLHVPGGSLSGNREFRFSVQVSSSDERTDTASVEIHTVSSASISILVGSLSDTVGQTGLAETRVNPSEPLTMNMHLESTQDVTAATWSLHEGTLADGLSLVDASFMTEVSRSFPAGAVEYPLKLRAGVLVAGMQYQFRLAVAAADGSSVVAGFDVQANDAPGSGWLTLSHEQVVPHNESLTATAVAWEDEDLPLSFKFTFATLPSVNAFVFRSLARLPSATGTLPEGSAQRDYRITLKVLVQDRWGAQASASEDVVSRTPPSHDARSGVRSLRKVVEARLTEANQVQDWDGVLLLSSVGASSLQSVNCSAAPNCSSLGREPCADEPNTCGSCLDGLVGAPGLANTLCSADTDNTTTSGSGGRFLATSSSLLPDGASCFAHEECRYARCNPDTGVCEAATLACSGDCSNAGFCVFTDYNGNVLSDCQVTDVYCHANCVCNEGWFGVDCSQTEAESEEATALRDTLIQNMIRMDAAVEVSVSSVEGQSALLEFVTRGTADWSTSFTTAVVARFAAVVNALVELAPLSVDDDAVSIPLLEAASNALPRCTDMSDADEQLTCSSTLQEALNTLLEFLQSYRVAGQEDTELLVGNLRVGLVDLFVDDLDNTTVHAPNSAGGSIVGAAVPTVEISRDALVSTCGVQDSGFGLSSLVFDTSPYGDESGGSNVNSTVVRLQTYVRSQFSPNLAVTGGGDDNAGHGSTGAQPTFRVTLRNPGEVQYGIEGLGSAPTQVRFACLDSGPRQRTVKCPDQAVEHVVDCTGQPNGTVGTVTCPPVRQPSCQLWNGTAYATPKECTVVNFTATTTTCECNASLLCSAPTWDTSDADADGTTAKDDRTRRRLLTVAPAPLDFAGIAEQSYTEFVLTWSSIDDLTVEDIEENIIIFSALCSILGLSAVVMFIGWRMDVAHSKRMVQPDIATALGEYAESTRNSLLLVQSLNDANEERAKSSDDVKAPQQSQQEKEPVPQQATMAPIATTLAADRLAGAQANTVAAADADDTVADVDDEIAQMEQELNAFPDVAQETTGDGIDAEITEMEEEVNASPHKALVHGTSLKSFAQDAEQPQQQEKKEEEATKERRRKRRKRKRKKDRKPRQEAMTPAEDEGLVDSRPQKGDGEDEIRPALTTDTAATMTVATTSFTAGSAPTTTIICSPSSTSIAAVAPAPPLTTPKLRVREERTSAIRDQVEMFVATALPDAFAKNTDSVWLILWSEICQKHQWISALAVYKESEPRAARLLINFSYLMTFGWVTAVLFLLIFDDDDRCQLLKDDQEACESQTSLIDTRERSCEWYEDEFGRTDCVFVEPNVALTTVMFVTLVSGIATAPVAFLVKLLVENYVAVATQKKPRTKDDGDEGHAIDNKQRTGMSQKKLKLSWGEGADDDGDDEAMMSNNGSSKGRRFSGAERGEASPPSAEETEEEVDDHGPGSDDSGETTQQMGGVFTGEATAHQQRPQLLARSQSMAGSPGVVTRDNLNKGRGRSPPPARSSSPPRRPAGLQSRSQSAMIPLQRSKSSLLLELAKPFKPATTRPATSRSHPQISSAHARFEALMRRSSIMVGDVAHARLQAAQDAALAIDPQRVDSSQSPHRRSAESGNVRGPSLAPQGFLRLSMELGSAEREAVQMLYHRQVYLTLLADRAADTDLGTDPSAPAILSNSLTRLDSAARRCFGGDAGGTRASDDETAGPVLGFLPEIEAFKIAWETEGQVRAGSRFTSARHLHALDMAHLEKHWRRREEREAREKRLWWQCCCRLLLWRRETEEQRAVKRMLATREMAESFAEDLEFMNDDAKSGMLLQLFFVDHVGEVARHVFRRNMKTHETHVRETPLWKKLIALSIVIFLNLSFALYIFLFSVRLGTERQIAWVDALVGGVLLDIFLFECLVVAILFVLCPMMVRDDVRRFMADVVSGSEEMIQKYAMSATAAGRQQGGMGAAVEDAGAALVSEPAWLASPARYYFPSVRVADMFPHLATVPVMKWILAKQLSMEPWGSLKPATPPAGSTSGPSGRGGTGAGSWSGRVQVHNSGARRSKRAKPPNRILYAFVALPDSVQDLLMAIFIPILFWGLLRVHHVLYFDVHPVLVVLPIPTLIGLGYVWHHLSHCLDEPEDDDWEDDPNARAAAAAAASWWQNRPTNQHTPAVRPVSLREASGEAVVPFNQI